MKIAMLFLMALGLLAQEAETPTTYLAKKTISTMLDNQEQVHIKLLLSRDALRKRHDKLGQLVVATAVTPADFTEAFESWAEVEAGRVVLGVVSMSAKNTIEKYYQNKQVSAADKDAAMKTIDDLLKRAGGECDALADDTIGWLKFAAGILDHQNIAIPEGARHYIAAAEPAYPPRSTINGPRRSSSGVRFFSSGGKRRWLGGHP